MEVLIKLLCKIGIHTEYETVFENGIKKDQTCSCGKKRHTMYDMAYGCTYWESDHFHKKNSE